MEVFKEAAEKLAGDYLFFIEYIKNNEIKLSPGTERIGKKDCFALNQHMQTVKESYTKVGRIQDFFTVIDFFYFFSVRGDICRIVKKPGKGLTMDVTERYRTFAEMTAVEQYLLMMAVGFGEYIYALNKAVTFFGFDMLFPRIPETKEGQPVIMWHSPQDTGIWGKFYFPELRLVAMFGLLRLEWLGENEEDAENKFRIKAAYLTALGAKMKGLFTVDNDFRFAPDMEKAFTAITKAGGLENDGMKKRLFAFWNPKVKRGQNIIELKIELGSCVRIIEIGDQYTLDDLSYLILKSVDFDDDHLYYFQIGSGNAGKRYYAPECAEAYDTGISLAELGLFEGRKLGYVYDFGDMWQFEITVRRITAGTIEECRIEKVKGENPEQYSDEW